MFEEMMLAKITSGFFIGFAAGYFLKKSFKIATFMIGMAVVTIFVLDSQNIVHVDNNALLTAGDKMIMLGKNSVSFLKEKLQFLELSGGAGAAAGFIVGLKVG
jgi:uncharacterized membrane protein (Fun14 family)